METFWKTLLAVKAKNYLYDCFLQFLTVSVFFHMNISHHSNWFHPSETENITPDYQMWIQTQRWTILYHWEFSHSPTSFYAGGWRVFVWQQFKVSVLLVSSLNNNPELNLSPPPPYPQHPWEEGSDILFLSSAHFFHLKSMLQKMSHPLHTLQPAPTHC